MVRGYEFRKRTGCEEIGKREKDSLMTRESFLARETLIKSLSDFTLEFLYMTRNNLTRIASYLRKAMTKSCIKILVESDSAI